MGGAGGALPVEGKSWRPSCKRIEDQIRFPSASTRLTKSLHFACIHTRITRYIRESCRGFNKKPFWRNLNRGNLIGIHLIHFRKAKCRYLTCTISNVGNSSYYCKLLRQIIGIFYVLHVGIILQRLKCKRRKLLGFEPSYKKGF